MGVSSHTQLINFKRPLFCLRKREFFFLLVERETHIQCTGMSNEQEIIRVGKQLEKIVGADQPVSVASHFFSRVRFILFNARFFSE